MPSGVIKMWSWWFYWPCPAEERTVEVKILKTKKSSKWTIDNQNSNSQNNNRWTSKADENYLQKDQRATNNFSSKLHLRWMQTLFTTTSTTLLLLLPLFYHCTNTHTTAVMRHCTDWYEIWALTEHELFYIKIELELRKFSYGRARFICGLDLVISILPIKGPYFISFASISVVQPIYSNWRCVESQNRDSPNRQIAIRDSHNK